MADIFTKKKRSELMSRIRSKGTKPELTLHGHLKAWKVPHQMWPEWIEFHPDIVIGTRAVVFVNGCFWHGCPRHFRCPATNPKFWGGKIARNMVRHALAVRTLRRRGWKVVTVWEHDLSTLQKTRKVAKLLKNI